MKNIVGSIFAASLTIIMMSGAHAEEIMDVTRLTLNCCYSIGHKFCSTFQGEEPYTRECDWAMKYRCGKLVSGKGQEVGWMERRRGG